MPAHPPVTPEGTFLQAFRLNHALRRHSGAGGSLSYGIPLLPQLRRHLFSGRCISYGIPSEAPAPASISLRKDHLRSHGGWNLPSGVISAPGGPSRTESRYKRSSGVISSPEGASRTESRLKPLFRRHYLAGGRISAEKVIAFSHRRVASRREQLPVLARSTARAARAPRSTKAARATMPIRAAGARPHAASSRARIAPPATPTAPHARPTKPATPHGTTPTKAPKEESAEQSRC